MREGKRKRGRERERDEEVAKDQLPFSAIAFRTAPAPTKTSNLDSWVGPALISTPPKFPISLELTTYSRGQLVSLAKGNTSLINPLDESGAATFSKQASISTSSRTRNWISGVKVDDSLVLIPVVVAAPL